MLDQRNPLVRLAVLVAAVCCLTAGRAEAAGCTIRTTSVAFGSYNVFATSPDDSTGTVVYRCNGNVNVIWITLTRGSSDTFNPRELTRGSDVLQYNLYRDASRSVVWGNLTGGTSVHYDYDVPNNRDTTVTVYGRIPAGQDVRAGSYSDTVTIEVWF